jgi:hypothetical protein
MLRLEWRQSQKDLRREREAKRKQSTINNAQSGIGGRLQFRRTVRLPIDNAPKNPLHLRWDPLDPYLYAGNNKPLPARLDAVCAHREAMLPPLDHLQESGEANKNKRITFYLL